MNDKKIFFSIVAITLLFLISGCVIGNYGRITREYAADSGLTLQVLKGNWQDYDVSYAGMAKDNPRGILFDPKKDDRKLRGDRWVELLDEEEISTVILWIENNDPKLRPYLYRLIGPDQQVYGYVYTATNHVVSKAIDDKTLYVFDLDLPVTVRSSHSQK